MARTVLHLIQSKCDIESSYITYTALVTYLTLFLLHVAHLSCTCVYISAEAGPMETPSMAQMELHLIQSKSDIESPSIIYTAVRLP